MNIIMIILGLSFLIGLMWLVYQETKPLADVITEVTQFRVEAAKTIVKTLIGGETPEPQILMKNPNYTIQYLGIGDSKKHTRIAPLVSKMVSESQAYQDYVEWDSQRERLMRESEKVALITINIKPQRGRKFKLIVRCNQKTELDLAYPNTLDSIRKFTTDASVFEYDMSYNNADSDEAIACLVAEKVIDSIGVYVDYLIKRESQILFEHPDIPKESRNAFSIRRPFDAQNFELMYIWSDWMYQVFNVPVKRKDYK